MKARKVRQIRPRAARTTKALVVALVGGALVYSLLVVPALPKALADALTGDFGLVAAFGLALAFGSARWLRNPGRILFPLAATAFIVPMLIVFAGISAESIALFLIGLGLLFAGVVGNLVMTPVGFLDPLTLTPEILVRAIEGTAPGRERPHPETVSAAAIAPDKIRPFARYLREAGLVATARQRGADLDLAIARIDAKWMPTLSRWILLFGATKVRWTAGTATVSVDPRAYAFLERPAPYRRYCENIVARLERAHQRFLAGIGTAANPGNAS